MFEAPFLIPLQPCLDTALTPSQRNLNPVPTQSRRIPSHEESFRKFRETQAQLRSAVTEGREESAGVLLLRRQALQQRCGESARFLCSTLEELELLQQAQAL